MGGFGGGLGRDLESLGASWAVLGGLFVMLVFGVVFESALKGIWTGFLLDFEGVGKDLGRILEGFGRVWEGFWSILGASGLLWVTLSDWGVFGWFLGGLGRDLGVFWVLLGYYGLFWALALACFGLLWLALACFGLLWLL